MRHIRQILLKHRKQCIFLGLLIAFSNTANAEIERPKILLSSIESPLKILKGKQPYDSVLFKNSITGGQFSFPAHGSDSLVAWYFQPNSEKQKYDTVEIESSNLINTFQLVNPKISDEIIDKWASILNRISIQIETISSADAVDRLNQVIALSKLVSNLPRELQQELQLDFLLGQLFLQSGESKLALASTDVFKNCSENISFFSTYCFELSKLRADAYERIGDFDNARKIEFKTVNLFTQYAEIPLQRSRLAVMEASAHQHSVHVAFAASDEEQVTSHIKSIRAILQRSNSKGLSEIQNGLIHLMLGSSLMRAGQFENAIIPLEVARKKLTNSSDPLHLSSAYSFLHSSHYVQGRYLKALEMIMHALEHSGSSSPNYHYYLLIQGNSLAKLGRYQQAKASLEAARVFYKNSQNPYYLAGCNRGLAVVERELGNFEAARKYHDAANNFFIGPNQSSPRNLYSFLATSAESVITNLYLEDEERSIKSALELKALYSKYFRTDQAPVSLPEKSILYALARYSYSIGDFLELAKYRDQLSRLLDNTQPDTYSLEKAQLEYLNLLEDLNTENISAATNHFFTLMQHVEKTQDNVGILSFSRGYSNLVNQFAQPLLTALSVSLSQSWDDNKANLLIRVLNHTQGKTFVSATRASRKRIALGLKNELKLSETDSQKREVEVFSANNQQESFALRAKADASVLRESIIEAKNQKDKPEKFVNQLTRIDSLIDNLDEKEIYLNSYDLEKHRALLYLSRSKRGVYLIEHDRELARLSKTAQQLITDRYSKPRSALESLTVHYSLDKILGDNAFNKAITTGDGLFGEIPLSAFIINGQYLGAQLVITNIASTSYYFSPNESFDIKRSHISDIAIIADPNFNTDQLVSDSRGADSKSFSNWLAALKRLPWTSRESRSIKAAFPDSKIEVGTKEQATVDRLEQYANTSNILHVATHGYFSPKTPELAGLALTKSDKSETGFISLNQLARLDIASQLVVFSACETALSEKSSGDSEWGLAQVALYAGANNAVGTLWKIPDRQTAVFFAQFYKSLATENGDISKSLRNAKRAMIDSKYSHPFYWSGFKSFSTKKTERRLHLING